MRGDKEPTSTPPHRRRIDRRLDWRVLAPALAVSLLVHLLLFRVTLEPDTPPMGPPPPPRIVDMDPVMRAYDVTTVTADVPPIDVQIREIEQQRQAEMPLSPWTIPPPSIAPPPEASSVRERLRYRMGSAEVWRPPVELQGEIMTPDEVVRRRVASELQQFNDSVAEAEAARARALDWSFTDSEGRRWGVAPGRIYVGTDTVTIPFEIEFAPPPGRRDEQRARVRDWQDIQRQAARVETQEAIEARIRAIRERAEQERRNQGSGSGGNGTPEDA